MPGLAEHPSLFCPLLSTLSNPSTGEHRGYFGSMVNVDTNESKGLLKK